MLLKSLFQGEHTPITIVIYAYGFGILTGIGCTLVFHSSPLPFAWFGAYLLALSCFHFLEYFITAIWNAPKLNLQAFCFPHSPSYVCALIASILEYIIVAYWFNHWVLYPWIQYFRWLGVFLIIMGQSIRSLAMIQASTNFSHTIAFKKDTHHQLVQTGVYKLLRHPAYFGFFWRSLGMQLILLNPVCFIGYLVILHSFFKDRIQIEESTLLQFFGSKYQLYKKSTYIGIPWI